MPGAFFDRWAGYLSRIITLSFNVASIRISHDSPNFGDPLLSIINTPQVPQHPPP